MTLSRLLGPPLILSRLLGPPLILAALLLAHAAPPLDLPDDPAIVALEDVTVDAAISIEPQLAVGESAVIVVEDDAGMVLAIAVMEPRAALAPDRLRYWRPSAVPGGTLASVRARDVDYSRPVLGEAVRAVLHPLLC